MYPHVIERDIRSSKKKKNDFWFLEKKPFCTKKTSVIFFLKGVTVSFFIVCVYQKKIAKKIVTDVLDRKESF